MVGEIGHFPGHSGGNPFLIARVIAGRSGGGDTGYVETTIEGGLLYELGCK